MSEVSTTSPLNLATAAPHVVAEVDNSQAGNIQKLFDRYVVNSPEELSRLNDRGLIRGAFIITGDKRHVKLHALFWIAQLVCKIIELFRSIFYPKREINTNLCHGAVGTGWDDSYNERKKEKNDRPLIAHAVFSGVKISAVDYFNYADKDVDHMVVYVPKDHKLREEFAKNAELGSRQGNDGKPASKFSTGKMLTTIFKRQIYKKPAKAMQQELAYAAADLLLGRNICQISKEDCPKDFYCMEYAIAVLQASTLTCSLGDEGKKQLLAKHRGDRAAIAKEILLRIQNKDDQADPLSKAYWASRVCTKINPNGILSGYADYVLNEISDKKNVNEQPVEAS